MELSLDLSLVYVPKAIGECLKEVSRVKDGSQKLPNLDDYVKRLEDERRKIDAFKRELPLCMLLLNEAIIRLKEEAMQCKELNALVPLKGGSNEDGSDKKNWMSSVQLWNTNKNINLDCKNQDTRSEPKQRGEEDDDRSTCENPIQLGNHGNKEGASLPFKTLSGFVRSKKKEEKEVVSQVTGLSLMTTVPESCNFMSKSNNCGNQMKIQSKSQQQQQHAYRKQRRCWSPELHRLFVDALQQLGGYRVATPKQIREFMQVDGLTNDEVKSHLQKYRLHLRKVPGSSATPANGLWKSQDQCEDPAMHTNPESNSQKAPLQGSSSGKATTNTGGDSMEAEDDDKSESHSWNGVLHHPGEVHV
ncbi:TRANSCRIPTION FACTOR HHO5 [Salix viminalis]|uniref:TRANSCRIPTION FACTOR HHO5 n=1 Tax=Salix viminalis TaxID=40686 RepID=A0A9Q0UVT8_SALVM|nr:TRANSCRIPTION FACTOR HHO5 [Salix viminalis]